MLLILLRKFEYFPSVYFFFIIIIFLYRELLQPMKAALQQCPGNIVHIYQIWTSTSRDNVMTALPSVTPKQDSHTNTPTSGLVHPNKGQVPNYTARWTEAMWIKFLAQGNNISSKQAFQSIEPGTSRSTAQHSNH